MMNPRVARHVWRILRLCGVRLDTPGAVDIARALTWLVVQQPTTLTRFPLDQNDRHTFEGMSPDDYWPQKIQKFLWRAQYLSLESPEGRQAVAELCATSLGLLASTWRLYGPPSTLEPTNTNLVKIE